MGLHKAFRRRWYKYSFCIKLTEKEFDLYSRLWKTITRKHEIWNRACISVRTNPYYRYRGTFLNTSGLAQAFSCMWYMNPTNWGSKTCSCGSVLRTINIFVSESQRNEILHMLKIFFSDFSDLKSKLKSAIMENPRVTQCEACGTRHNVGEKCPCLLAHYSVAS